MNSKYDFKIYLFYDYSFIKLSRSKGESKVVWCKLCNVVFESGSNDEESISGHSSSESHIKIVAGDPPDPLPHWCKDIALSEFLVWKKDAIKKFFCITCRTDVVAENLKSKTHCNCKFEILFELLY